MAWLVKTEPGDYTFDDLAKAGQTIWDGVRNPQAVKNLRSMAVGDRVFVYHTGDERCVVGRAEVSRTATEGREVVVELRAIGRLGTPVPLAELKADRAFDGSPLLRQGRLSVVPLTPAQVDAIEKRGGV